MLNTVDNKRRMWWAGFSPQNQRLLRVGGFSGVFSLILFAGLLYPEWRKNNVFLAAQCEPYTEGMLRPEIRPYRECYQSCVSACVLAWSPTPCSFKLGMHRTINEYDIRAAWFIAGSCYSGSCCAQQSCDTCQRVDKKCDSDGSNCQSVVTNFECNCRCVSPVTRRACSVRCSVRWRSLVPIRVAQSMVRHYRYFQSLVRVVMPGHRVESRCTQLFLLPIYPRTPIPMHQTHPCLTLEHLKQPTGMHWHLTAALASQSPLSRSNRCRSCLPSPVPQSLQPPLIVTSAVISTVTSTAVQMNGHCATGYDWFLSRRRHCDVCLCS